MPSRATGSVISWIGKGSTMLTRSSASQISGSTPSSRKVVRLIASHMLVRTVAGRQRRVSLVRRGAGTLCKHLAPACPCGRVTGESLTSVTATCVNAVPCGSCHDTHQPPGTRSGGPRTQIRCRAWNRRPSTIPPTGPRRWTCWEFSRTAS
ncbi:hypothetical protein E1261_23850 [Kribbella albertanoniae]|uniref:Uncharacterized protein n=1 Tax=Kribbella albertanoniae TaxID=1266829 RepID=A0A4R4PTD2_9ACTN|nr:hypothetical protein E1261_23850 [Kribbella albertanoniae]